MQSNVDVVLAAFRAVETRDRAALFELYHDDVEFHEAPSLPYGGSAAGKAALRLELEATPEATWIGTCRLLEIADSRTLIPIDQPKALAGTIAEFASSAG